MTGPIAVGIIIVGGPASDGLEFSADEQAKVVAEVQNGLGWLATQGGAEAAISWTYDVRVISLTVPPDNALDFGQKERLWRDPVMEGLGYSSGMSGVTDYVNDLRSTLGTQWAYVGFFTKYPLWSLRLCQHWRPAASHELCQRRLGTG